MAKIYSPPKTLPVPVPDYANYDSKKNDQEEMEWIIKLREFCVSRGNGAERGEVVRYPVADGYAQYMVFSIKPLALIHMPLGDAWQYRDVDLQTVARIRGDIQRNKAMAKLFSGQYTDVDAPPVSK